MQDVLGGAVAAQQQAWSLAGDWSHGVIDSYKTRRRTAGR